MPDPTEPMLVMLTEIKGDIKLILSQISDLMGRMTAVETQGHLSESRVQTLEEGFRSEEAKKVALALALKEAEAERRTKSEATWTPVQRLIMIGGFVVSIALVYVAYRSGANSSAINGILTP
jgi:hypothetical protein